MAYSDPQVIEFAVRRYTEEGDPNRGTNLAPQTLGAGTFVFGAIVEGAFIPLVEKTAGGVLKKIERHKAAQALATPDPEPVPVSGVATTADTSPAPVQPQPYQE